MKNTVIIYSNKRCVVTKCEERNSLYAIRFNHGLEIDLLGIFDADEVQEAIECADYFNAD